MSLSAARIALLILSAGLWPAAACAEIYRYTDGEGRLYLSDKPPRINARSHTRALTRQSLSGSKFSASVSIYKFTDAKGIVHLTDKPPDSRYRLIYSKPGLHPFPAQQPAKGKSAQYAAIIEEAAKRTNLEPALLHAVIQAESAYNPNAISSAGAVGLMQLMPGTALRYGVSDRYDPASNIIAGAHYLRDLLILFNNDMRLALAGYNAGENAVKRYGNEIPPYKETRYYVSKVMALYEHLRQR